MRWFRTIGHGDLGAPPNNDTGPSRHHGACVVTRIQRGRTGPIHDSSASGKRLYNAYNRRIAANECALDHGRTHDGLAADNDGSVRNRCALDDCCTNHIRCALDECCADNYGCARNYGCTHNFGRTRHDSRTHNNSCTHNNSRTHNNSCTHDNSRADNYSRAYDHGRSCGDFFVVVHPDRGTVCDPRISKR